MSTRRVELVREQPSRQPAWQGLSGSRMIRCGPRPTVTSDVDQLYSLTEQISGLQYENSQLKSQLETQRLCVMNVVSELPRIARSANYAAHRVVVKGRGVAAIWEKYRNEPTSAKRLMVATLQQRAHLLPGRSQDAFPLVAVEPCGRPTTPASAPASFVLVFSSTVYVDMLLGAKHHLAKELPLQHPSGPPIIRAPLKLETFMTFTEAAAKRQLQDLAPHIYDAGFNPSFQHGSLMAFDPKAARSFEIPYATVLPIDNHPLVQLSYCPPPTAMDPRFPLPTVLRAAKAASTALRGVPRPMAARARQPAFPRHSRPANTRELAPPPGLERRQPPADHPPPTPNEDHPSGTMLSPPPPGFGAPLTHGPARDNVLHPAGSPPHTPADASNAAEVPAQPSIPRPPLPPPANIQRTPATPPSAPFPSCSTQQHAPTPARHLSFPTSNLNTPAATAALSAPAPLLGPAPPMLPMQRPSNSTDADTSTTLPQTSAPSDPLPAPPALPLPPLPHASQHHTPLGRAGGRSPPHPPLHTRQSPRLRDTQQTRPPRGLQQPRPPPPPRDERPSRGSRGHSHGRQAAPDPPGRSGPRWR